MPPTAIPAVAGSFFSAFNTSGPVIFGSSISNRIKSGFFSRAISSAFAPSIAVLTSYPARASARSVANRRNLLSSTSRIFVILALSFPTSCRISAASDPVTVGGTPSSFRQPSQFLIGKFSQRTSRTNQQERTRRNPPDKSSLKFGGLSRPLALPEVRPAPFDPRSLPSVPAALPIAFLREPGRPLDQRFHRCPAGRAQLRLMPIWNRFRQQWHRCPVQRGPQRQRQPRVILRGTAQSLRQLHFHECEVRPRFPERPRPPRPFRRRQLAPVGIKQFVFMRQPQRLLHVGFRHLLQRFACLKVLSYARHRAQQETAHQVLPVLEPPVDRRRIRSRRPRHRPHRERLIASPLPQCLGGIQNAIFKVGVRLPRHLYVPPGLASPALLR